MWSHLVTGGHNLSQVFTPGHIVHYLGQELKNDGLNSLMAIIPLSNLVTGWSQSVTFVTGEVMDLRNVGFDDFCGSMAPN